MQQIQLQACQAKASVGSYVCLRGHVYALRRMGNLAFIVLRDGTGTVQIVVEDPNLLEATNTLTLETPILASGQLVENQRAAGKAELLLHEIEILSESGEGLPVEINKDKRIESLSLASMLDYRPLTLRNERTRAIFKVEAALCAAFRQFLTQERFTEIHSPKIVSTGTEGGAQLFKLDYFGKPAFLAQSPQFYKQMMVGVFERVFEIGPVYRAEEHDTSRHLNEYISMDFEFGFIKSEQDIIELQVRLLSYMFEHLNATCSAELKILGASVPTVTAIPQVTLEEAARILIDKLGWQPAKTEVGAPVASQIEDLDPDGERLLCQYFGKTEGCELVYITRYPLKVRPFYAMPLEGTELSRSFDLLFRGLEITTGGQRIHRYEQLIGNISARGLAPESFSDYLQCFRYGMPPHGGLAIGLERLAKQLLGLPNVKLASLFPRDRNRISP